MIRNLFTKHDHRIVPGITKEQAMQGASWYWRSRNFGVTFSSPYNFYGSQFYSKLGLRQSVSVYAVPEGSEVAIDLSLSAELTDEGAVVGVLGAVILLPVTVAVGAVSYVEYENDAQRLIADFWGYMYGFPKNPAPPAGPAPAPSWAQGQPPQPVAQPAPPTGRKCPLCNSVIAEAQAKFCMHCGARL
jgi:hypothetical protein